MEWEIVNLDMEFKVNASVEKVFEAWTNPVEALFYAIIYACGKIEKL